MRDRGTFHQLFESVQVKICGGGDKDNSPIPRIISPAIIPLWLEPLSPPRKWYRIPKATVKRQVPATMKALRRRTFMTMAPRMQPAMTEAKLHELANRTCLEVVRLTCKETQSE